MRGLIAILLRRLLANDDFREMFLRYCGQHLQTTFEPNRALALIDMLAKEIESEIPADRKRWRNTYKDWGQEIELMRQFARERPEHFRAHLQRYFRLSDEQMVLYGITEPD